MKNLLLILLLCCASAFAQMTVVTGTLSNPDSTAYSGPIHVSWGSFEYGGQTIPGRSMDVLIVGGNLNVTLWPNVLYTVSGQYNNRSAYIDMWYVPASPSPVTLSTVHFSAAASAGVASFNGRAGTVSPATNDYSFSMLSGSLALSQIPQNGATSGQALAWNGAGWSPATLSGGGGSTTAGSPVSSVQFNCATAFCGDAAFQWNNTNKSLTLNGAGSDYNLLVTKVLSASGLGVMYVSATADNSIGSNAQQEVFPIGMTYSGSNNQTTLSGMYTTMVNANTGGSVTHFLGQVSRMYHTGTGNSNVEAAYYGDALASAGSVTNVATFADFGRALAGSTVTNSFGLWLSSTATGSPANDYGIAIPDYSVNGRGTVNNVGLTIGGVPDSPTNAAIYVATGSTYLRGQIINNVSPVANVDYNNLSQNSYTGASTGTIRGIDTVLLSNMAGGQVAAGITGARFTVYNGASGTTTNLISLELSHGAGNMSGAVTNAYGLKIDDDGGGATITNSYGVYIGSQHGYGSYTNAPYGIYQSDAAARNFFAGSVSAPSLTITGTSFAFNGKTCTISGASISCT